MALEIDGVVGGRFPEGIDVLADESGNFLKTV
jgi:hypothetical protein